MCGIAGIIAPPGSFSRDHLLKMSAAIAHRGPDGSYEWESPEGHALLAHRRLAILDLSEAASQPMHFLGRYSIIHNGEIYNYLELKRDLTTRGYAFRTASDTEVILAAYDCYRSQCVERFNGMFSFAIWDEQEKILFAARDRFGEKPFFYSYNSGSKSFLFASEIKALWAAGVPRQWNDGMLVAYLGLGLTSHPEQKQQTFYSNIYSLPAAHYLEWKTNEPNHSPGITNYWEPPIGKINDISEPRVIDRFRELFDRSIAWRLRSDVAIGTSLSGGLDSSSVLAGIHQSSSASKNYRQQAFTAGFKDFEKDESVAANKVAAGFGLKHHLSFLTADDFADEIAPVIKHHDEPIGSSSVYAQYKVFELAREEGVTVLLDGQGADELLGGYSKYIHWYLQELISGGSIGTWQQEKRKLQHSGTAYEWGARNWLAALFPGYASSTLQRRAIDKIAQHPGLSEEYIRAHFDRTTTTKPVIKTLNDLLYYNARKTGLDELLRYADKNSMAHGREIRLPFLDHELAEFVFKLPSQWKIRDGYSKWILRKAMEPLLPQDIIWNNRKTAFEPPQEQWMGDKRMLERIQAAKETLVSAGILDKKVLAQKIQPHSAYAADCNDWRYLVCGILYK